MKWQWERMRGRLAMATAHQFTAIIEREDDSYVALYPELDIASQRPSVEDARLNLKEAIEFFSNPLLLRKFVSGFTMKSLSPALR
jgi:hypothetical protein